MAEFSPDTNETNRDNQDAAGKQPWEPMCLTYLGNAADLLQSSQGKFSIPFQDPGDARPLKTRGQG
jgi:hypothetical protein